MSFFPFFHHIFADDRADHKEKRHRNEREECQERIHAEHFEDRKSAEKEGVKRHHDTGSEAILYGFEVVREKRHQVADLIDLIIVLGKVLAMVKHSASQICFHADAGAKETDAP